MGRSAAIELKVGHLGADGLKVQIIQNHFSKSVFKMKI